MKTKEILSIVALAALGLCLLCCLAKAAMKGDKGRKGCDKVCGAFVFLAIILLAVSQLLGEETEKYDDGKVMCTLNEGNCEIGSGSTMQVCGFGECNNTFTTPGANGNCCKPPFDETCFMNGGLPCCKSCCEDGSPAQCFK